MILRLYCFCNEPVFLLAAAILPGMASGFRQNGAAQK